MDFENKNKEISNSDVIREVAETYSHDVDELFVHMGKLDSFGKKIIKEQANCVAESNGRRGDGILIVPDQTELKGRHLYKKYPELRDLSTVMEHPEFFAFYLKYMRDPHRLKQMMVLMKLYHMIGQYMHERDPLEENFNSYHKLVFLHKLITNPVYSRLLLKKTFLNNVSDQLLIADNN